MIWADWAGYLRDLAGVCFLSTVLIYLYKIVAPGRFSDRLAAIALAMAFLASGGALWGGLAFGAIPAWALFTWPLVGVFWLLETEFGTKILGFVAALSGGAGLALFPWGAEVQGEHQAWRLLTASGALLTGAFEVFALATWLLVLLYRTAPALSNRKTARFFTINGLIVADLAYRLNGWALPFAIVAAVSAVVGLGTRQVPLVVLVLLMVAGAASTLYAVTSRQKGRPAWLLMGAGALLACYGSLGLTHLR